MSLRVLLSAPYMIPVYDRFRPVFEDAGIEVVVRPVEERLSETELLAVARDIDGAISGDDRWTAKALTAAAPRLKVIAKWGTGIDSIDQATAQRLGIRVCNTPDAFTDAVADSVMAYVLAFARRTPWMDRDMKAGNWSKSPGKALHEASLGVIGVGRIGRAVLRRASSFGMHLLGNDIIPISPAFVDEVGVSMLPLGDLLAGSDFVSLNCDLNPTSERLIDRGTIGQMKAGAILINTARGPIIDEAALVQALKNGRLGGAALDVFESEPLPVDSPLLTFDNVLLAPHNANSSPGAWERVHWNTIRSLFLGLGLEPPSVAESGDG